MIDVPTSYGELIDKITILEIKKIHITDVEKLKNVTTELSILTEKASTLGSDNEIDEIKKQLYETNLKLWKVEDELRDHESLGLFNERFIELARSVYHTNDERSVLKKRINKLLKSVIVEEKSYNDYTKKHHKITVLLSIYEAGEWIKNRLDNLMELTNLDDCEIWCVNANSPDPRDHEIPQSYPKIRYVKLNERLPLYKTWNYILQRSSSYFVTNANADDIVAPDCYEVLASVLESDDNIEFAYPSWHCTAKPNQTWEGKNQFDDGGRPGHFHGDIDKSGIGHFPMWRRSLHHRYGYFDENFRAAADAEWWMRCFYKGAKFVWVDKFLAMYLYRHGQNLWHRDMTSEEWLLLHTKIAEHRKNAGS